MKEAIIQYNDNPDADGGHMVISWKPLVRCKDCKKRNSWECWQYFFGRIKIPDDWFCADGEKKVK